MSTTRHLEQNDNGPQSNEEPTQVVSRTELGADTSVDEYGAGDTTARQIIRNELVKMAQYARPVFSTPWLA